jgi:hypothetical protein
MLGQINQNIRFKWNIYLLITSLINIEKHLFINKLIKNWSERKNTYSFWHVLSPGFGSCRTKNVTF